MLIHLISGPRNLSTAMMYAFAQRTGCTVFDEPFYGCYLRESGAEHPGREEILRSMPESRAEVWRQIRSVKTKEVFVKNMAHHILKEELEELREAQHVFLIRRPERIIQSYAKVMSDFQLSDLGLLQQAAFARTLAEKGTRPIVLDTDEFLQNPLLFLQKLCEQLSIPFLHDMLKWKAGSIPEDGIWAKYWYKNVHASTGFGRPSKQVVEVAQRYHGILKQAMQPYAFLKQYSLK